MAAQKRKSEIAQEKRPEKKQRAAQPIAERPSPHVSVLRDEEEAFPRGGKSVLTPLEKRQIQKQARDDVLFEQSTGKKAKNEYASDSEDGDLPEEGTGGVTAPPKTTRKSRPKDKSGIKRSDKPDSSDVRVEGLSYKRLVQGSVVLGQITSINKYDLTVSLPNNLVGYVPLTAISEEATQVVEKLAAQEDSDEEAEDGDAEPEEFHLSDYAFVGQFVRAYVTSVGTQDAKASKPANKRRVMLSLMPQVANGNLSKVDLVANNIVQASVKSVEDHGLVMSVGLEDSQITAFMGSKETPSNLKVSDIKPGAVMLCLILGFSSNGKVAKLSASDHKLGNPKRGGCLTDAPSVDAFQPGSATEMLVTAHTSNGVVGKVMGMLDATADLIHCSAHTDKASIEKRYPVGSKAIARVICTFPTSERKKIGVSLLPHLVNLALKTSSGAGKSPKEALPVSSIVKEAKITSVEPGIGVFLDVGVKGVHGFAHISRLSDEKVTSLATDSGPYKVGSTHTARIVSYNPLDGLFIVSLEKSVIDMPFLNIEDVKVGEVVKATVEKVMTNAAGSSSVLLRLTSYIDGLVPEMHLSDIQLQNPEKKFKEGSKVTARVLSVDLERRRLRFTLKKTLVNSEDPIWSDYASLSVGSQAPGTIVNILPAGAVVQYYGNVRGFLPVAQMSETFIKDPRQHFRVGQVVSTHILSVESEEKRLTVSCRDPSLFGPKQQAAFDALKVGALTSGSVSEKTQDEIVLEVGDAKVKAILHVDQLADGSVQKCQHAAKRIRVGQTLQDLLVLQKFDNKHLIHVTNKPALLKASRAGTFPDSLDSLEIGKDVVGFVRNVTSTAVYVQFASGIVGLLPRTQLAEDLLQLPSFGLRKNATITSRVLSVDTEQGRFVLTQKDTDTVNAATTGKKQDSTAENAQIASKSSALQIGSLVKAKISSVKETQLNVSIGDGIQARIDISQVFDTWDEIKDRKRPLASFKSNDVVEARVMGVHNHRNHKFLPITHSGKAFVYELTAKKSDLAADAPKVKTLDQVEEGEEYLCFVNNVAGDCLWVNISPSLRGRVAAIDASDDTSILSNLAQSFPPGSAIRARVLHADTKNNHLDLSARNGTKEAPKTFADLKEGVILPGKVTRISERHIMVQLSDTISGPVHLVEMADDFSQADPSKFEKNQITRVHVSGVDAANKKLVLSTRPSKVLSSSLPVKDKEIKSLEQLKINDVVRGFVKNVADNGLFIALSSHVTAFVRVAELSDSFIKDWKAEYEVDRLVQGKVIALDAPSNHLQLSLKQSVLENKDYKPPLTYHDIKVGQIVTGKVRKVEDFGVFVVLDNSVNVSGLCHRSEIADEPVSNVKSLYEEGDMVKAKVLKVDHNKRRVAFGLKASYFPEEMDVDDQSEESEADEAMNGVLLGASNADDDDEDNDDEDDDDEELDIGNAEDTDDSMAEDGDGGVLVSRGSTRKPLSGTSGAGLNIGGPDWNGANDVNSESEPDSELDADEAAPKKKRRKAQIQVDRTAELDTNGPQSVADFERLLLTDPNSSLLWLSYMAHYLKLNEIVRAREIAERAIKTVNHQSRETEEEAMNLWIGYLNLENTYGTEESVTEVFTRAVQYNDSEEIHSRLTSIYIQSGKADKADELLQAMVKKFSQDPKVWLNYADFLFDTVKDPVRGRDVLPRALQALPKHQHVDLTTKFAQLEFRSERGDAERGRTMFEGLISTYPKRLDLYNILIDLEQKSDDKDRVRRLFQRAASAKLKPKQAKFFFKRWLEYEEKNGDAKSAEKVKARAEEYVRKLKGEDQ